MKFPEVQGIQKRKSMVSKEISFLSWHFIRALYQRTEPLLSNLSSEDLAKKNQFDY